jgi:hypothetical protein
MLNQKHYFLANGRNLFPGPGVGTPVPDRGVDGSGYNLWSTGVERRTETLSADGTMVIVASEQDWSQRAPINWTSTTYASYQTENDNRVNEERKILETSQTARSTTIYDLFNNPTETSEFDFDNTLKRRMVTSYSSTNLVNGVNYADDSIRLLRLPLQQSIFDSAGVEQARTTNEYDIYTGDGNHDYLLSYASVSGHDTANYGASKTTRGNATSIGSWIKSSNTYLYTYPRYDILGNVVSAKDARGNVSTINFADDFGDGSNPGSGMNNPATPTYALPTLITSPPPNVGEQPHTARSQYDFSTGLLTGFKDRNGIIAQTTYNDPFNRPTLVKSALGVSAVETHAAMYYAPATAYGRWISGKDSSPTASGARSFKPSAATISLAVSLRRLILRATWLATPTTTQAAPAASAAISATASRAPTPQASSILRWAVWRKSSLALTWLYTTNRSTTAGDSCRKFGSAQLIRDRLTQAGTEAQSSTTTAPSAGAPAMALTITAV